MSGGGMADGDVVRRPMPAGSRTVIRALSEARRP
jgi:hypothetical protein